MNYKIYELTIDHERTAFLVIGEDVKVIWFDKIAQRIEQAICRNLQEAMEVVLYHD